MTFVESADKYSLQRAFTLIELMAAVGIIALLATLSMVGLSAVRESSRVRAAMGSMSAAQNSAFACLARGSTLNDRVEQGILCDSGTLRWPVLPTGWVYDTPAAAASDASTRTFSFSASGDGVVITCTQDECIKT